MILDLFDDDDDPRHTLTEDEVNDVRQAAFSALAAVDGEVYDDTLTIWHRHVTGPQVFMMPLRPYRQSWGISDAYGTVALPGRLDH